MLVHNAQKIKLTTASDPTLSPKHTGVMGLIAPTPFPPDILPCKNNCHVINIIC